jgi:hypothetical protein
MRKARFVLRCILGFAVLNLTVLLYPQLNLFYLGFKLDIG